MRFAFLLCKVLRRRILAVFVQSVVTSGLSPKDMFCLCYASVKTLALWKFVSVYKKKNSYCKLSGLINDWLLANLYSLMIPPFRISYQVHGNVIIYSSCFTFILLLLLCALPSNFLCIWHQNQRLKQVHDCVIFSHRLFISTCDLQRASPFKQMYPSWWDQGGYFWHLENESSSNDGTSPLKCSQSFIGIYEDH